MTYTEKLTASDWQLKRLAILQRDEYKCKSCAKNRTVLRNLVQSFGIVSINELAEKNVALIQKDLNVTGQLHYQIDGKLDTCILYIPAEELNSYTTRFALQKQDINIFMLKSFYRLVCFPQEMLHSETGPDLHVHHNYYVHSKDPWDYQDDVLITYCADCHTKWHEENVTPVYSEIGDILYKAKVCHRCGGSGYLPQFDYYMNGVCFGCSGEGIVLSEPTHT